MRSSRLTESSTTSILRCVSHDDQAILHAISALICAFCGLSPSSRRQSESNRASARPRAIRSLTFTCRSRNTFVSKKRLQLLACRGADGLDARRRPSPPGSASATPARRGWCSRGASALSHPALRTCRPPPPSRTAVRRGSVAAPARARARPRRTARVDRSGSPRDRAARRPGRCDEQDLLEAIDVLAGERRHRDHVLEPCPSRMSTRRGSSAGLSIAIDLVERQHPRRLRRLRTTSIRKRSPPPDGSLTSTTTATSIDLFQRVERRVDHADVEAVQRLDGRRACRRTPPAPEGLGLSLAWVVPDADDAIAGGLRLVGNDRELLSDEAVEERGLAGVGPADQRDEAPPSCRGFVRPSRRTGSRRLIRTRVIRRRCGYRRSPRRGHPLRMCSPTAGTRPRRDSRNPPTVSKPSPVDRRPSASFGHLVDVRRCR